MRGDLERYKNQLIDYACFVNKLYLVKSCSIFTKTDGMFEKLPSAAVSVAMLLVLEGDSMRLKSVRDEFFLKYTNVYFID